MDRPVNQIAQRLNATADQVLLAWVKAKGAVAVTYVASIVAICQRTAHCLLVCLSCVYLSSRTSSKKPRLEGYLAAADLSKADFLSDLLSICSFQTSPELTPEDIAAIDAAGAKGARRQIFIKAVRTMAELMLIGAIAFRIYAFFADTRGGRVEPRYS